MSLSAERRSCSRCGAELPPDASQGLCPACLLAAAMEPVSRATGEPASVLSQTGRDPAGSEPPRLQPGQQFGPYQIERLLGRGGMGEVYAAEHVEDGRRVALKVLRERLMNAADRARFLREGQLAASINHPHTVYVFGSDEIDGIPVISMELAPKGTLKHRVDQFGSMSSGAAVEAILQVIAGLDAASTAGILHRDVKPSNCFIASDGTVKVGDFGLSVSNLAREVRDQSPGTTFNGTPEFAAPEQLRGEALDVHADIYAVGATLYYLLTGRPPFDERNVSRLIERVATETPLSPDVIQPGVPKALAAIIMRCLARDPLARPGSYAALTEALRPLASTSVVPATLSRRFIAELIDDAVLLVLHLPATLRLSVSMGAILRGATLPDNDWLHSPMRWFALLAPFVYYGLLEGLWGRSIGKRILGLRVMTTEGAKPGVARAVARLALLKAPAYTHTVLLLIVGSSTVLDRNPIATTLWSFASGVWPLIVWLSARQDGSTMIHDRITDTRVVADRPEPASVRQREPAHASPVVETGTSRLGPFDVLGVLWSRGVEELRLGFDPVLKRQVWLHIVAPGTPALSQTRRDMSRQGRVRWLTGRRSPTEAWDAFEVPAGSSFEDTCRASRGFATVKLWLIDLLRELGDAESEHEHPRLSLDHVWITPDGRAQLLDFEAPRASGPGQPSDREAFSTTPLFLLAVAQRALEGPRDDCVLRHGAAAPVGVRMPLSIRVALDELAVPLVRTTAQAASVLEPLSHGPDTVSRWRRALPIGLAAVPVALMLTLTALTVPLMQELKLGDAHVLSLCLKELKGDTYLRIDRNWTPKQERQRDAFEVYVVGRFPRLLAEPQVFTQPDLRGLQPQARMALIDHPQVSPEQVAQATAIVQPLLDAYLARDREAVETVKRFGLKTELGMMAVSALTPLALGALLLSLFKPGGITLGMAGIAVVNRRGESISRGRSLLRTLITWAPILVAAAGFLRPVPSAGSPAMLFTILVWLPVGLMMLGGMWALVTPERGLQDRLSGTFLVPR